MFLKKYLAVIIAVVLIAALYLGRAPAVLSAMLGVLAFDFFLVPPGGFEGATPDFGNAVPYQDPDFDFNVPPDGVEGPP